MKVTTLVPTHRNDGSAVAADELQAILQRFWVAFGGCTVDGRTEGYWVDGGRMYSDECLKVFVVVTEAQLPEVESLVREIGQQLGQLAMYLEVDRTSEVRIMEI